MILANVAAWNQKIIPPASIEIYLEYSIFYDNEPESYDFCGEVEYELENINDTIILFSSKNKTFPEKNPIRCHY